MLNEIDIHKIIDIAQEAGRGIMDVYVRDFEVTDKADKSPLTEADKIANDIILKRLLEAYPQVPYISEEVRQLPYAERKDWEYCWLIDPLDGTKEFIKKNGEFTVNIALIHNGLPVLGVIDVPVRKETYFGVQGNGSYKIAASGKEIKLQVKGPSAEDVLVLAGSRSHPSAEMEAYVNEKRKSHNLVDFIAAGSSLKFCMVAEGRADEYPRFGPTMEWDTAAGHAIVLEAGGSVTVVESGEPLQYNKEDLLNPYFIVRG